MTTRFSVGPDEAGERIDVLLVRRFPGVGRATAKEFVSEGAVRIDGHRAKKGDRVREGAIVELAQEPRARVAPPLPDPSVPLTIVFEDEAMLVVDKPAGVPTHPLEPDELGTIANALVARMPELASIGFSAREPGLVHRLDVDTSGLLVIAKTEPAFDALVASLRAGTWDKRYLALVAGRIDSPFSIDAAIAKHPSDPRRVLVTTDPVQAAEHGARTARTEVTPRERFSDSTLVEVGAHKALRHQVRAHLASIGHPLVSDPIYGGPKDAELERHFLHASSIVLPHPTTGKPLSITSPLPEDLERALTARRSNR